MLHKMCIMHYGGFEMNTNDKGNIAVAKVIADLVVKGWHVFTPVTEHGVVDLIAYKDEVIRLQIKYSASGIVKNESTRYTSKGSVRTKYSVNDFDYYGVYLPNIDKVIYIPSELGGINIRTTLPEGKHEYYWYE